MLSAKRKSDGQHEPYGNYYYAQIEVQTKIRRRSVPA
jgi:hypothetical protein